MDINLNSPIRFKSGAVMKNKFMLAPMTNKQSHEDGTLSDDEFKWLVKRAEGQFGMVMTCASHVQAVGKGFEGQLGIFDDKHMEGHKRLSAAIQSHGSLAVLQLHHAGMRSPKGLIGEAPVCPTANEKFGARALSLAEVHQLRDDFISAAVRSKACGYDGVEVHGAHGYILTQFLSAEINNRTDEYGGSLENRKRILFEIVDGIHSSCGDDFLIGVRLSPEKFGMDLEEIKTICQKLIDEEKIDFLDISLWDVFKDPEDPKYQNRSLLDHVLELDRKDVKLTVAGKIYNGSDVAKVIEAGIDFVAIGKSGILHHDFPSKVMNNPDFKAVQTPVSVEYLAKEGLGDKFIEYMKKWPGFVEE
jgi:2,4-dienoyl-CoA reductase-like NADH-dependent reductase (Old Yellow Enzyme family)